MEYITIKRARFQGIAGDFNLPYGTKIESDEDCLLHDGKAICFNTSQRAYDYFSRNDDGNGLERGRIVQAVMRLLAKRDAGYQDRWNKIWEDDTCKKYKRSETDDYWLWNHEFYQADIETLKYIANLIGAKM